MTPWAEFAEKLERLENKAFCRQRYVDGETFCAVGAFIPEYASVLKGSSPVLHPRFIDGRAVVEGEGGNTALVDEDDVNEEAQGLLHTLLHKRTGLDKFELNRVQACNDMFAGTPKARYTHVLQTVREIARQEV